MPGDTTTDLATFATPSTASAATRRGLAMKTYDFDAVARQAAQHVEQAVQRVPDVARDWQSADPNELLMLGSVLILIVVFCTFLANKRGRGHGSVLDKVLFWWDRSNPLTVRDLVAGGIHVAGGTGSGKTSSFKQIARDSRPLGQFHSRLVPEARRLPRLASACEGGGQIARCDFDRPGA